MSNTAPCTGCPAWATTSNLDEETLIEITLVLTNLKFECRADLIGYVKELTQKFQNLHQSADPDYWADKDYWLALDEFLENEVP